MCNRRESRTSEEALRRTGELADQHRPAVCMWSKNVREWHRGLRRLVALYPVLNALALSCALHWGGPKRNWAARRKDCAPPRPYMRINSCAAAYGQIGTSLAASLIAADIHPAIQCRTTDGYSLRREAALVDERNLTRRTAWIEARSAFGSAGHKCGRRGSRGYWSRSRDSRRFRHA